ncbi:MAG: carboxyl transferase domain-containing protein, partial [Myxococcota bacterium]
EANPNAEIAVMGASGAVEILHGKELRNHEDPDGRAQELTDEYNANFANPGIAEARGFLDAVIEPAETRRVLLRGLHALIGKREDLPYKRNGNVPL